MNNSDFCHLHNHTEFSFLDGFGTPENYAKKAVRLGFKYLACTDHGSIDGLIKFQVACEKHNIIPILGCESYITPEVNKERKNGHIILLVKNRTGFRNLTKMLSFANSEGFYYKPRITYDILLNHTRGLVISTACVQSFINMPGGQDLFQNLYDLIGNDLYCEIQANKLNIQKVHNNKIMSLAEYFKLKVIATNDSHYINASDWKAQEMLLAIQRKALWDDPKRFKFTIKGLHLKSVNQMKKAMQLYNCWHPKYLSNTIDVAEKCCNFKIKKRKIKLPKVGDLSIKQESQVLWFECKKGFQQRFGEQMEDGSIYDKRFQKEFDLIKKKNFIRYFLIVYELVTWCKENEILIGPRGSVCSSLIAFLLGITGIDPIKHDLLFSRFISEDRIDYPDIDIDFENSKRHLVKEHLEEVYGIGRIANVSSFSRLKSRAAVSDIARTFGIPPGEVNRFTKLIDYKTEDGLTDAIEQNEEGREFKSRHPQVVRLARKLEGQVRNRSQHAAAIIISQKPLKSSGQCVIIEKEDVTLTNWEKDDAEYMGLMKLDALGLKFLSILSEARRLVKENYNTEIDFEKIPLDDKKIFKFLSDPNNLLGIFQLSGYANRAQITQTGIKEFNDIAITTSLARPGPLASGMTHEYNTRKRVGRWTLGHPIYEKITKDTLGVVVFQEQVMKIISEMAGLPESTADKIRKVIGKKRDVKEFEPYRKQFISGCRKTKTFSRSEAKEFWNGLLEWSSYGFGKGHAVGYSVVAYWCAYLKYYYPTEFICASLTFEPDNKTKETVEEAYKLGLSIILPRISSPYTHLTDWVAKDKKLYIPYTKIKGIGKSKAKQITNVSNAKTNFYQTERQVTPHKGALGNLLTEIQAYRSEDKIQEVTPEMTKYFDFRIVSNPKNQYANLYNLFNRKLTSRKLDPALCGDLKVLKLINKKIVKVRRFKGYDKDLSMCLACDLINECTAPVPPSQGRYNIMIIGQDPGYDEDKDGIGFIGASGKQLWSNISYNRSLFHITNINKCYPSKSRKSSNKQIKLCSSWLKQELESVKPILILALGNSPLYYFTGKTGGITELSGSTTWNERYSCWICWSMHPASILHNANNKPAYIRGIKNFKKTFAMLKTMKKMV